MKDQFTPYLESIELKRIGFNEPCYAVYGYNMRDYPKEMRERLVSLEEICYTEGCNLTPEDLKNSELGEDISAPNYHQVFDWFREKHSLFPIIFLKENGKLTFRVENKIDSEEFETYKECQFNCLKYLIGEIILL
jgi:hypothetical protein